jgi:hydrogenase small subunit
MGCRGPTTYNSCSTVKWNNGTSFPIGSGHGCIGCSESGFWDNGPFYQRLSNVVVPGIDATPDRIGAVLGTAALVGVGAHLVSTIVRQNAKTVHADDVPPSTSKGE